MQPWQVGLQLLIEWTENNTGGDKLICWKTKENWFFWSYWPNKKYTKFHVLIDLEYHQFSYAFMIYFNNGSEKNNFVK